MTPRIPSVVRETNGQFTAFNAALVLGACVLVQVDQKASSNDAGTSFPESTEDMTLHLGMAIEALRHLDLDNRMVARCRDYLEQFVQVVQSLGKEFFHLCGCHSLYSH